MNILFITYQGDMAGSTNSISYLAKGLAARGHTVVVGCRKEALLVKLVEGSGVIVEPMTFGGRFDIKNMKQIRDLVNKYSIEVINAQSSYDRYTTVLARWIYRLPCAVVHTRRQYPKSMGGFFQNLIYVKGTDNIVVVSDSLKPEFVKKGIPAEHIKVIYNGIPKEKFTWANEGRIAEIRAELGIHENDQVVGCVSRPKKQEQLLEALSLLDKDIKLLLVGVPEGHYAQKTSELQLKNEVIYAGKIPPEEVMNYYSLMNVSVLPSTTDGFGLVLVEAMGMGIPVVATRSFGLVDVIKDGENGLLFEDGNIRELADKIKLVLENNTIREKLIKNGLETAHQKFTTDNTVSNYEVFFKELIEKKKPRFRPV